MICLICRHAETVNGLTSISFERGELRLIVNNVPARVCPNCAEAYVDEAVATQLLWSVKKLSEVGILEDLIEYNHLP
jgi:YgiT-type zinc finger domain-containing protein